MCSDPSNIIVGCITYLLLTIMVRISFVSSADGARC